MKPRLKYYIFLAAGILFFILTGCSVPKPASPEWKNGADIPIPVRGGNTASYSSGNDGWLVIVSGRDSNSAIIKTVQRYIVKTNVWDTLAPHPTGLLGGATTSLGNYLYVIGGVLNPPGYGESTVYKYSIDENKWLRSADFPSTIVDAKAVSYQDSLIYVGGGISDLYDGGLIYLYNSNTNSWRKATPFPSGGARSFGGFAITGDTIIYMCGTDGFGSENYFDSVYVGVINPEDHSDIKWTSGKNFPGKTRTFFDAYTWNGGIIMTGGSTDNTFNASSNECYFYNAGKNEWTKLPNKKAPWLTGQSGSTHTESGWELICASGYDKNYLSATEVLEMK